MRLLVTRPEPDASAQGERLGTLGHQALLAPLSRIEFGTDVPIVLEGVGALIVTSRNALRALALHPQRNEAVRLPLYAVGEATAAAARSMGLANVTAGPGTGEELARLIATKGEGTRGKLLHLSGETVAFDLKSALEREGLKVERVVLYRTVAATGLPPEARAAIQEGRLDGVILMSPLAGSIFRRLVEGDGLVTQMSRLNCYCLSQAVAETVESLGMRVAVARHPREEELLALVASEAAS